LSSTHYVVAIVRVAVLSLVLGFGLRAEAQPASVDLELMARLYVSSNTHGHLADPVCTEDVALEAADPARAIGAISRAHRADPRSLMVDTGAILGPHAVARFATQDAPEAFARVIADLGYNALALGETELGIHRSALIEVAGALRARGVPVLATNLYCAPSAQSLCDVLVDGADGVPFFELGPERIALFSFLSPEALGRITPENAVGVRLAPLRESMVAAVRAARARGATTVIATVQDGSGADAVSRLMHSLSGVASEDKPDLVLSAEAGAELIFARPTTFRPAIASAPSRGAASVEVRRDRSRGLFDVLVQPISTDQEVGEPLAAFLRETGAAYCSRWARPLQGAHLGEAALDADGMLELTARILRETTGAEIALLGRGVTDSGFTHVGDSSLSGSDIYVALQYDDPLATATVDGDWLQTLARSLDPARLLAMGLSITGANTTAESVEINGRPLELRGRYRIVTSSFLATGGDALLPPGPTFTLAEDDSVRGAVMRYLERPRDVDPREDLPDLADRIEWASQFDTDATFSGSSVRNPGAYSDSQLSRENTAALGLSSTLAFSGTSNNVLWDNTLAGRYSLTQTSGSFDEGDDVLSYRTSLRYRGLHARRPEVYVPDPFFEAFVESEFTESDTLGFHHLLVRPTVGFAFTLTSKLLLKLSGGFEVEALDPDASVLPGVGGNLQLKPWELMRDGARSVKLGLTIDYFVSDLGGANRQTLRTGLDTTLTLSGSLSLALLVDLFGVREGSGPFSLAINTTAALRLRFVGRRLGGG